MSEKLEKLLPTFPSESPTVNDLESNVKLALTNEYGSLLCAYTVKADHPIINDEVEYWFTATLEAIDSGETIAEVMLESNERNYVEKMVRAAYDEWYEQHRS